MNQEKWITKRLGKRIRQLRSAKGWSQEGFAFEAGIDRSHFGAIERGEKNPTVKNVARIADKLNVSITVLFEAANENR